MKIAIISDTHWGVRDNKQLFLDSFGKFYEEVFFPALKDRAIDTIIHCGDLLDNRKSTNTNTLHHMNKHFMEKIHEEGMKMIMVLGNHDTFFKNTVRVNAPREIYSHSKWGESITFVDQDPLEITLGNTKFAFIPWITPENHDSIMKFLQDTTAATHVVGHFDIKGFEMYPGFVSDRGLSSKTFEKFHRVFTGHYHFPSERGNIKYMGSPYQTKWNDYGHKKGFWIYDTETDELEFIENRNDNFIVLSYEKDEIVEKDVSYDSLSGKYIKLFVKDKQDVVELEKEIEKILANSPEDLKIIDDSVTHIQFDTSSNTVTDMLHLFLGYVEEHSSNSEIDIDKSEVQQVIHDLYDSAQKME